MEKWREGAPPELREVLAAHPKGVLSGVNVISAELRRIVWDDALKALVLGFVLVYLLMWADLGGPVRALLALVPLIVGMVWMLGAMAVFDLKINFFNIFVLTMIVGIGVAVGLVAVAIVGLLTKRVPAVAAKTALIVGLVVIALLAITVVATRSAPTVEVAVARSANTSGTATVLNASGYVIARSQATVSSKVTGKVIEHLAKLAILQHPLKRRGRGGAFAEGRGDGAGAPRYSRTGRLRRFDHAGPAQGNPDHDPGRLPGSRRACGRLDRRCGTDRGRT